LTLANSAIAQGTQYVMRVWSDNFTDGFFVSFIVTAFVPDIEGI